MGSQPHTANSELEGVIPRAVKHVFYLMKTEHVNKVVNIRVSFLEIYNEEIRVWSLKNKPFFKMLDWLTTILNGSFRIYCIQMSPRA
jgi:hypothetical protein